MKKLYCRSYQKIMYLGSLLMPWREPRLLRSNEELAGLLKEKGCHRVLLVSDPALAKLGLFGPLQDCLAARGIGLWVYADTVPNPTVDNVEQALALYLKEGCQAIIGFGGGSAMDCAKAVAARVRRPGKSVQQMKGLFKVLGRLPCLVAVPTTAGTGSETTAASVIVDPASHHKYVMMDLSLIPHYALMDAGLTLGLPRFVTATTGMDALTHAVEAHIGKGNTRFTRNCAEQAVQLIFEHLETAYQDGSQLPARSAMHQASYLAGLAFTRAYVGNVHALSHAISGRYGTAHGLANAIILPLVLEDYAARAEQPLKRLARLVGLDSAQAFVAEIRAMNSRMGIPTTLDGLQEADFDQLCFYAEQEANPLYPVPVIYGRSDFRRILKRLKGQPQGAAVLDSQPSKAV